MLPPDANLHDRYRVIYAADERPGSTVYRARDEQSGRLVLIAEIGSGGGAAGADLDELRQLARQVAGLHHEALLPLLDHFDERGAYYIVCEDMGGQDLERVLRARGAPLPEGPTLAQVQRLLGLVDYLHTQKPALFLGEPLPSDLWIGDHGDWKLTPFTLVRPIGPVASPYRAPELDRPQVEPTAASDLYALSALVYQALTGWVPPGAEQRAAGTPLNGPRTLNPALSTLVEQVLLRGLELKSENRYQVARELHLSLDMVQMMDGRSLGSGPNVTPPSMQAPPVVPPQMPPLPSAPSPVPGPYQQGSYPAPLAPVGPGPQPVGYPPAFAQPYQAAPDRKRGLSTGCLIAVAVVLLLVAVAICAALAWFIPQSPLPGWFGLVSASVAAKPTITPAIVASPTPLDGESEPTTEAGQPAGPVALPTPLPSNLGPNAISIANVGKVQETRAITGSVLGPVAYSPDGKLLAVGVSNSISLRDADTLQDLDPPRRLAGHSSLVFALAWSPDSTLLASGGYVGDNVVRIWSPGDGRLVRELKGHADWIRAVTFSPDGKLLASGSYDKTVRVWEVATGDLVWTLAGHTSFIGTVVFAPDGKTLASSATDGTARLWDLGTGQPRQEFSYENPPNPATGQPLWATGLSFTPDGRTLAIGSEDGSIALVDAATGKSQRSLTGHTDIVVSRGLQFSPDGRTLASASFDGSLRLWDVASGHELVAFKDHGLRVLALSFSPDGTRVASTSDQGGQLYVWDVKQRQVQHSIEVGQGLITALTFSPDGAVLGSIGYNGVARLYGFDQDRSRLIAGAAGGNKTLAFADNGRVAIVTAEGSLALLSPNEPQPRQLKGLDGRVLNVVSANDGRLIVAGSSTGAIGRWDSDTGVAQPALASTQLQAIYALAASDDGALVAAGGPPGDSRIELWDLASGKLRATLTGGTAAISALAFQPHGKLLAATDLGGKLRIWNTEDGKLLKTIAATPQQQWFAAMAFSPDGTLIVGGALNGEIVFWNAATGAQASSITPHDAGVFAAAFSPDGRRLALGFADTTARIFELQQ